MRFLSLPLLLVLSVSEAHAIEYNLPDPPNAITFDVVRLRSVSVPSEKIPDTCDARYRSGMERAFREVWDQCQSIGKAEPSDCQRALFDRCTDLGADLQKMEAQTCTAMLGESDALLGFQTVDNQKTSQASTADLNARAYAATERVIASLERSSRSIDAHRKTAGATLAAGACAGSTASKAYGDVEGVVTKALDTAKAHLKATIDSKKAAAAEFARNAGKSGGNLAQLVSKAPVKSTITSGSSRPLSANETSTAIANDATTAAPSIDISARPPPTTTVVSTTTSTPVSVLTVTSTAPAPLVAPAALLAPPPPERKINWVPILAVGIPAAILTAIVVSKLSKNRPSSSAPDATGDGPGQGGDPSGSVMPGAGGKNPTPAVVPGGGDLDAWKITVDPSFTDRQRAIIATAFSKVPACYRFKLQGLHIQNKALARRSDGCVAGMFIFGGNTVYLSPSCTVAIGVTVHEFFHVIGNRNDNAVHQQWKPVSAKYPRCPVTTYGGTNFYEDFAESGRLLIYPDSSAEAKNSGACVDAKIQGLGEIMKSCPK